MYQYFMYVHIYREKYCRALQPVFHVDRERNGRNHDYSQFIFPVYL